MRAIIVSRYGPPDVLELDELPDPVPGPGQVRVRVVAAALPGAGQAAHTALRELVVGAGDVVLVHGAAGAVGTVAVQLAREWGARRVLGTASPTNHEYLRSLGVEPVEYGPGLVERVRALEPRGVDVALDAAGSGEALAASVALARDRSRVGTLVDFEEAEHLGVRAIRSRRSTEKLAELVELCARGRLRIHVRAIFPLEDAASAHRDVGSGHGRGKVVLRIGRG